MSKRQNPYVSVGGGISKRRRTYTRAGLHPAQQRRQAQMYMNMYKYPKQNWNRRTGGFIGMEVKFYDTAKTITSLTAPTDAAGGEIDPTTGALNTIAQGDGEQNRDGRQCTLTSVHINGIISVAAQTNQTDADEACSVFVALVLDTQTNGAQLNSEDVFTNGSAAAYLAATPFRNLQYTKRFKVLKSELIELKQPTIAHDGTNIEQGGYHIPFRMDKKLDNIQCTFTGATATVASIMDNSLHIIAYCSTTATVPQIAYNARVRFKG